MQKILFKYIVLPVLSCASIAAFYYLNTVQLPLSEAMLSVNASREKVKEQRKVVITDPITKKKRLIIIEPPKWIDTVVVDSPKPVKSTSKTEHEKGRLPDIEFLKFVIEKSREGIPVLSTGSYLNLLYFGEICLSNFFFFTKN